ncbi:MAG: dihydrofolate reductase family protein [Ferruginibacter sp.]
MRKLISSINITLDGYCNHEAVIADDELHQNAIDFLSNADNLLLGRVTYQLMKSGWAPLVKNTSGNKPMDDFALLIHNIPKIVFSRSLTTATWNNSTLATRELSEEVVKLKEQQGKNIGVGGPTI